MLTDADDPAAMDVLVTTSHRAHCSAADAGALTLSGIEDGPARLYRTEDLEGHRWMFMQRS